MSFFDRLFMATIMGKREAHWGAAAGAGIFLVLCFIGLIIYGIVSGNWQWCIVGGIDAIFFTIITIICIIVNIRKNSNRW